MGTNKHTIIKPLEPKNDDWVKLPLSPKFTLGYDGNAWSYKDIFLVFSTVEAPYQEGMERRPEYHLSMSRTGLRVPQRVESNDAEWILKEFDLEGAEEDNHVPGGVVRNFWRPVADFFVGKECPCKKTEMKIIEDKGDFVWKPAPK